MWVTCLIFQSDGGQWTLDFRDHCAIAVLTNSIPCSCSISTRQRARCPWSPRNPFYTKGQSLFIFIRVEKIKMVIFFTWAVMLIASFIVFCDNGEWAMCVRDGCSIVILTGPIFSSGAISTALRTSGPGFPGCPF